jgi:endonuclease III
MTTSPSYERVFERLKKEVPQWSLLLRMDASDLSAIIADAGLSAQKAPRMLNIAEQLARAFGTVTLRPLETWSDAKAEAFLTSLPGVGTKTAKCVLMYALGRAVLPVDTHVRRVSRRLGLTTHVPISWYAIALEKIVPPDSRYQYHVNALAHGREICRALRPKCFECPLVDFCASSQHNQDHTTADLPRKL